MKGRCWRYPRIHGPEGSAAVFRTIAEDIARARAAGHVVKEVAICPVPYADLLKYHFGRCCHHSLGCSEPPPPVGIDVPMVTDRTLCWHIEVRTDGPTYLRRLPG